MTEPLKMDTEKLFVFLLHRQKLLTTPIFFYLEAHLGDPGTHLLQPNRNVSNSASKKQLKILS
jgi:hypothetical protein